MKPIPSKYILILLIAYTFLLFYLMIIGFDRTTSPEYKYNLVPFSTITFFSQGNIAFQRWLINIVGNIVVFIPFGFLLPCYFKKLKISVILFLITLFILEALQYLTRRGLFDIDDFILNLAGFFLGYLIFKILLSVPILKKRQR